MQQSIMVALPTGEVVSCIGIATSCSLEIGGKVMKKDLI